MAFDPMDNIDNDPFLDVFDQDGFGDNDLPPLPIKSNKKPKPESSQ